MIDQLKVENLIADLKHLAANPKSFLGTDCKPEIAKSYLYGFRPASGLSLDVDHIKITRLWHDAIEANGYRVTPRSPENEREKRRISKTEVVLELIRIEQTLFRYLLEKAN